MNDRLGKTTKTHLGRQRDNIIMNRSLPENNTLNNDCSGKNINRCLGTRLRNITMNDRLLAKKSELLWTIAYRKTRNPVLQDSGEILPWTDCLLKKIRQRTMASGSRMKRCLGTRLRNMNDRLLNSKSSILMNDRWGKNLKPRLWRQRGNITMNRSLAENKMLRTTAYCNTVIVVVLVVLVIIGLDITFFVIYIIIIVILTIIINHIYLLTFTYCCIYWCTGMLYKHFVSVCILYYHRWLSRTSWCNSHDGANPAFRISCSRGFRRLSRLIPRSLGCFVTASRTLWHRLHDVWHVPVVFTYHTIGRANVRLAANKTIKPT